MALNESWDPDVRDDMEMMLNKIVPEGLPYRHSCEGPDDMVCILHKILFQITAIDVILPFLILIIRYRFELTYNFV